MKTLIKWPGGKSQELKYIHPKVPKNINRLIVPFLGGGAYYFDTDFNKNEINDLSAELIDFYYCLKKRDNVFKETILDIDEKWMYLSEISNFMEEDFLSLYEKFRDDIIDKKSFKEKLDKVIKKEYFKEITLSFDDNSIDKIFKHMCVNIKRKPTYMKKNDKKRERILNEDDIKNNFLTALKSGYYGYIRELYNDKSDFNKDIQSAIFFFIREFCYSSMFRYNKKGQFNVPYGGLSYNNKNFLKKINHIASDKVFNKFKKSNIYNLDFELFLKSLKLTEKDFIFLDPPYDDGFSTYSKNKFGEEDHRRLEKVLSKTKAKFMMVIKSTDLIDDLYFNKKYNIVSFDNEYLVNFNNRNNKKAKHLIITNYSTK